MPTVSRPRLSAIVVASVVGFASVATTHPAAAETKTPAKSAPSGPEVTFAGFRMLEGGGSRIEVELTQDAQADETLRGKKAEYLIRGARIPVRNNRNPLVTREFDSVVLVARLVPERGKRGKKKAVAGVRLVVSLREAVKPTHRVVRKADGTATFMVEFPKPSKPVKHRDEAPSAPNASQD